MPAVMQQTLLRRYLTTEFFLNNHLRMALSPTPKPFLGDDFLLETETARILYHEYAAGQPIIDYHCHLPPDEIAENRQYENLTRVWLNGDHYKWRALRTLGVSEKYITGDATDWEKFEQWAAAVPFTVRNPLYHWTHLELRRYFGENELLGPATARGVFDRSAGRLKEPEFHTRGLLTRMGVEVVCTTDDPADSLAHHQAIRDAGFEVKVLPSFRPDKSLLIQKPDFVAYMQRLGAVAGTEIRSFADLLNVLEQRAEFFASLGGRLADHGLEQLYVAEISDTRADATFRQRLAGQVPDTESARSFQMTLLHHLGELYHRLGWTQQFHLGALRNNNSRLFASLGPDTGFDSIGDFEQAVALSRFLDRLDTNDRLPRTILYNLNPRDNEVLATMTGNFNDGSIRGKVQFGSGWWFLDQKDGMEKQLTALSNMGMLSCFVGMLTDSRSFLSFPRHEYFRRILCNLFGRDVHNGELPNDPAWLGSIVQDICYRNAKAYFNF